MTPADTQRQHIVTHYSKLGKQHRRAEQQTIAAAAKNSSSSSDATHATDLYLGLGERSSGQH
jgi:hypothetical protein